MKFQSTKRIGPISTGHRQWKAENHCRFIHGYGRYIEFLFEGEQDDKSWIVDFGGLKGIKKQIEEAWDHKTLIASNDPKLDLILQMEKEGLLAVTIMDIDKGHTPGIEGSCKWAMDTFNPMIQEMTDGRCYIKQIRIWEHENNSALIVG